MLSPFYPAFFAVHAVEMNFAEATMFGGLVIACLQDSCSRHICLWNAHGQLRERTLKNNKDIDMARVPRAKHNSQAHNNFLTSYTVPALWKFCVSIAPGAAPSTQVHGYMALNTPGT